ncbi:hypothetical protein EXN66_Car012230 [Channa argus]|uniref:Uncharacterized protein n=1 Tax=Channa argus TaxID=215402 RepID=A0A6G1Q219_CHAAH|nr:hypothetical protein EXN66_Car012230 [Channa argus]
MFSTQISIREQVLYQSSHLTLAEDFTECQQMFSPAFFPFCTICCEVFGVLFQYDMAPPATLILPLSAMFDPPQRQRSFLIPPAPVPRASSPAEFTLIKVHFREGP